MLGSARRGLYDSGINFSGTMLRNNHPVHPRSFGGTQQRTKVIHILNGIKDEQEWSFLLLSGIGQNLVGAGIVAFLHLSQAALVYGSMTQLIEAGTRYRLDWDVATLGFLYNCSYHGRFTLAFGKQNTLDTPMRM